MLRHIADTLSDSSPTQLITRAHSPGHLIQRQMRVKILIRIMRLFLFLADHSVVGSCVIWYILNMRVQISRRVMRCEMLVGGLWVRFRVTNASNKLHNAIQILMFISPARIKWEIYSPAGTSFCATHFQMSTLNKYHQMYPGSKLLLQSFRSRSPNKKQLVFFSWCFEI